MLLNEICGREYDSDTKIKAFGELRIGYRRKISTWRPASKDSRIKERPKTLPSRKKIGTYIGI
ncbi:hypothetical protein PILCRDRAFT_819398 [Piloderma croceum F 1598]|uniref:Uncharacterized protein n=1 Tax=Piloderma croceum (strain F 1598) TaxID=765440 RepID=A0A0C3FUT8_PILCF|nr:hypothetical protein PILCRDRAFT_819398 [Piloderma croceum F 1598]